MVAKLLFPWSPRLPLGRPRRDLTVEDALLVALLLVVVEEGAFCPGSWRRRVGVVEDVTLVLVIVDMVAASMTDGCVCVDGGVNGW